MFTRENEPNGASAGNPVRPWRHLAAVAVGVLPLYAGLLLLQLRGDGPLSVTAFLVYLAGIAPVSIAVVLLLLRFLCRESPRTLNRRTGTPVRDLAHALVLVPVIFAAGLVSTQVFAGLFPESPANESVRNLMRELAGKPALLTLFAGPLLLLGAASEELVRTFFLSRLWGAWPAPAAKAVAVLVSAGLFGLVHAYQGPVHVAWTAVFGLLMALDYLRFGRILPLVLAHWLSNSLQIVAFAALSR